MKLGIAREGRLWYKKSLMCGITTPSRNTVVTSEWFRIDRRLFSFDDETINSGAPVARRAAKRSPILIWERNEFSHGYHS